MREIIAWTTGLSTKISPRTMDGDGPNKDLEDKNKQVSNKPVNSSGWLFGLTQKRNVRLIDRLLSGCDWVVGSSA